MGLDQYAHALPAACLADAPQVDFEHHLGEGRSFFSPALGHEVEIEELHYWRKHPDLQGWMKQLYERKGGTDQQFNCSSVRLMPEDIDALEQAVKNRNLPKTSGFFFGASSEADKADDLAFIEKARDAIAAGKAVWYTSWW
jgi:hypothetical protein